MRISVKGALIGGVLDIVLSAIIGIPFGIYAFVTGHLANTPREQLGAGRWQPQFMHVLRCTLLNC
jgi:hypothetical protein